MVSNNLPLISVIIPLYNTQDYIEKCVCSVLNQTYPNVEIIVINDGSTDNSLSIVTQLTEMDQRVKVYSQQNKGVSAARNLGLDKVNGKYIAFLDSDDYFVDDYLEVLFNLLVSNNCDIACCEVNENGNSSIIQKEQRVFNSHELMGIYLKDNKFYNEVLYVKLYKKELFDGLRFWEGKIHEDTYLCFQLLEKARKVAYVNYAGYIRMERSDSITNVKYTNRNYDVVDANAYIYNHFKGSEYDAFAFNKYLGTLLYFLIKTNGDKSITKNNDGYVALKQLLHGYRIKDIKPHLIPFVIAYKIGLLKFIKI